MLTTLHKVILLIRCLFRWRLPSAIKLNIYQLHNPVALFRVYNFHLHLNCGNKLLQRTGNIVLLKLSLKKNHWHIQGSMTSDQSSFKYWGT